MTLTPKPKIFSTLYQAMAFPPGKGRFTLQNGVESYPPCGDTTVVKKPAEMSIKELKVAIKQAGLTEQCVGFSEKAEFVELLEKNCI
jgi:hypothetical protein